MESFNGTLISSETVGTTTTSSTTTTTVTAATNTANLSASNGNIQRAEDDSNFDRLTQMLPECFVSVKLEGNEDTCATETSTETVSSAQDPSSRMSRECAALPEMQDTQQSLLSSGNRITPSTHCFHHRGSIPELPPWLQHCYTSGQMSSSDATQHFHQSIAYNSHEGSLLQTDRSLKPNAGVARLEAASSAAGIGGLSNGDICDSNTFLTYVLNQQRSSGIFLFDPIRSLHATEMPPHQNENNTNSHPQTLDEKHADDVEGKNNTPPSVIPPIVGNPSRRDAATNTISKFAQTFPSFPLQADAKTNTGDFSDDSDRPRSPKQSNTCYLHHCTKCVVSKITHMCHEGSNQNLSADFTAGGGCHKVSNLRHCSVAACTNHRCEAKGENGKIETNFVVVSSSGTCQQESCSCLGETTCAAKEEGILSHSLNSSEVGAKFSNMQVARGIADCKCMNDCGNMCVKDNRRLHYVDVDRPFTCEICLKNYPSSTALMNHMRYHRGQRPYQCEVCNKAFATNSHLVTHRRVHTGERPFQCRLCRRSFADRSAFVKHERTHGPNGTIIKRYKCDECGNSFVDSCGLKKHVRIHTGERPYCCSVCQKTFSTSSTFVAHKRIHSGERPYKCENCDKMFITKSHLLTHRRTHTGEKPFNCQVCNRAFADGSSFRRHERLHTGENRHTCDVCGKGFPFDTSLAKHKQSHIPGTPTYVYMV